jgi:hypothetical protein
MRTVSSKLIGGLVLIAVVQGLASAARAGAQDDERLPGVRIHRPYRPWSGQFDLQVLVGGRPLPQESWGGERRVEAVAGTEYELRLFNPLPDRVAVAVSVDGLNVIDARHTTAWDASKWVIHPHGTLTLSGWQVGRERARRFYFTTERDAYATRIGRPGEFGVISAVFYRERRHVSEIIPRRLAVPERENSRGSASAAPATARSAHAGDAGSRRPVDPFWRYDGRAATGIGSSVRSEVQVVSMELEPDPVALVILRYGFRLPSPRPLMVPGFTPEPGDSGGSAQREDGRFAPEPH